MCFVCSHFSVLTIGFETTEFNVREDAGSLSVPVIIIGTVVPEAGEIISVTANSADGSATGESLRLFTTLSR